MANKFGNFIADVNRWSLPQPPDWWLSRLFDFDNALVIIPSRKTRRYVLCRKRKESAGFGDVAMVDNKHVDTNMFYAYGVVPIAPLVFKNELIVWKETDLEGLLRELKARDTWAVTNGPANLQGNQQAAAEQKLFDHVEGHEKALEQRAHRSLRDMFYHRARDAYRSLKARSGQRSKRASDYHGVSPTPRPGRRIIVP